MNMTKNDSIDKKDTTKKPKKLRALKGTFIDKAGKMCTFTNKDSKSQLIIE